MKQAALFSLAFSLFVVIVLGAGFFAPRVAVAAGAGGTTAGSSISAPFQIPNPLNGTTDLPTFIAQILQGLVMLLTPVMVIMVVYAGFLFVTAHGNAEKLGEAKKVLMYTMIGIAIVLGASGLAVVIKNTVGCLASSTTAC